MSELGPGTVRGFSGCKSNTTVKMILDLSCKVSPFSVGSDRFKRMKPNTLSYGSYRRWLPLLTQSSPVINRIFAFSECSLIQVSSSLASHEYAARARIACVGVGSPKSHNVGVSAPTTFFKICSLSKPRLARKLLLLCDKMFPLALT